LKPVPPPPERAALRRRWVYDFLTPTENAAWKAGEWQTMDITLLRGSDLDLTPPEYAFGDLPVDPSAVPGGTKLV